MPGDRLSPEDRRDIAVGLAAGLGYAEIARRLGRPTSTISREVARNLGTNGYRADEAVTATSRRARRRKPAPPQAAGPRGRLFEERFVELMVRTGVPRMPARVLTALYYTDSGSLTAAELVQHLRVSPASISHAVGYLEGQELVGRARDGRRERYFFDDAVWGRSWQANVETNTMWADLAREAAEALGAETPVGARLASTGGFFERLYEEMTNGGMAAAAADARTVLAALVHAGRSLTAEELAGALDWPQRRVVDALHDAEAKPNIADPLALQQTGTGAYTFTANPTRLTAPQRAALTR